MENRDDAPKNTVRTLASDRKDAESAEETYTDSAVAVHTSQENSSSGTSVNDAERKKVEEAEERGAEAAEKKENTEKDSEKKDAEDVKSGAAAEKSHRKFILAAVIVIVIAVVAAVGYFAFGFGQHHIYSNAENISFTANDSSSAEDIKASVINSDESEISNRQLKDWYYNYITTGNQQYYYLFIDNSSLYPGAKGKVGYMAIKGGDGVGETSIVGPVSFKKADKNSTYEIDQFSKAKYYFDDGNGKMLVQDINMSGITELDSGKKVD